MTVVIKDGSSGDTAEVDSGNRLRTFSTNQLDSTAASLNGDAFFIANSIVNLTSTTVSHIFYVKNDDTVDWIISVLAATLGASDGTDDLTTTAVKNPTGGTLISAGTAMSATNMNQGSAKVLAGTFLQGVEGSTITGGEAVTPIIVTSAPGVLAQTTGPIVLPPGTSISVGITPPAGNTDMNAQVTMVLFRNMA